MASWTDRFWYSAEGIRLHYRNYEGPRDKPPILCIPGLTRNARDFEPVAERYAGDWRILCVDLRGRGMSDNDPDPSRYTPQFYVADIMKLLDQEGIADAVFMGTSLGGICTMLLASSDADRIAGAMLNDIGPEIDQTGIDRIGGYVGREVKFGSWEEAADTLEDRNREVFPHWQKDDWERFAQRIMHETSDGIAFQYDMRIAENFRAATEGPQGANWHLYECLAGRPVTILRGELSDLLAPDIAGQMVERLNGDAELVVVPAVGHTPNLEEPESQGAMDRLLKRVMDREED
ncbi:alpha/beta hydrolase [Sphingomonas sp. NSE70-1]|uniref:Alpha/beta hydrolase n=1 Tax=Sphingomonas caseinilyticus TaxID=2908205 RepID=A0ABT0RT39_9SPHN|nr:alpha/beta hydrolase [Sphingomonas caseinilyticus]MCL6698167.1 alpha/beta hydrolase [Sphingomonas caseinilyticus]